MKNTNLLPSMFALTLGLFAWNPPTRADGVCTERVPTAAEKKSYADAYALFLRAAPKAPDGWTSTDHPATGTMPRLCKEDGSAPVRRGYQRSYHLERGRQERDDQAVQSYVEQAKKQQATAAANQAAIDAIDAKINALTVKVQAAATAQRFAEVESLTQEMDALMQKKMSLMGLDGTGAEAARIEAEQTHDTEASFSLWFETPTDERRTGNPYRAAAGKALLNAYDDGNGNPVHDVRVYFGGAPQQARVTVRGDPARVRALLDAADLAAIATFR